MTMPGVPSGVPLLSGWEHVAKKQISSIHHMADRLKMQLMRRFAPHNLSNLDYRSVGKLRPLAKVLDMAEDKPVVLTVTADGDYSLNVGPSPDEPLSSDRIVTIVGQVLAARPEAPVAVRGDGQGNYADVVRGMVMLQQAGAEKVGLITDNVDASDSGSR